MDFDSIIYQDLKEVNTKVYNKCLLKISNFIKEKENKEYNGCQFKLNQWQVICRKAKITPKKVGQFVTFWKRNTKGVTEPFNENDVIDFYIINVCSDDQLGQFVFPKSALITKGIISTSTKKGKRGFRVYPSWDIAKSKQAIKTQQWQLEYFWILNNETDFQKVKELYDS